jgi:nitric oxide reductase subunit C
MKLAPGRRILFTALVGAFVIQTVLVYVDDSGYETPHLSDAAQEGRELWRKNNCQSCHQLYGFGGFLGPDLTNAVQHLADERLQTILTVGMSPMPPFQFSSLEIDAISSYLAEVDATGTGQFRFMATPPVAQVLDQIVSAIGRGNTLSAQSETGYQLFRSRKCISCHLPNLQSTKRAPDLCDVIESPGAAGIAVTLQKGRIGRGMPQFELNADEQKAVISFLQWMHNNRDEIRSKFVAISVENAENAGIPWFEYDR